MSIKIGVIGSIKSGAEQGMYVKVITDAENTGGYLVLISQNIDMISCFDNWIPNEDAVTQYFIESGWLIEWLGDVS